MEVTKWYTRALKIPSLVGRLPGGTRIPFGPFTVTQVLVGFGIIAVYLQIGDFTAWTAGVPNVVLLAGVVAAVVFGLGKLPPGANPVLLAVGCWHAMAAPSGGDFQGKPLVLPKSRKPWPGRTLLQEVPPLRPQPEPDTEPTPDKPRLALSEVQRQLATS